MRSVSRGEIDSRGLELLHRRFERFWDDVLRKFSHQFLCVHGSPSDSAPPGGSEDARGLLDLAGEAGK
jgi:hypothetical protein